MSMSMGVDAVVVGVTVKSAELMVGSMAAWLAAIASCLPCMPETIFRLVLLTLKAEVTSRVIITRMIIATKRVIPDCLFMAALTREGARRRCRTAAPAGP